MIVHPELPQEHKRLCLVLVQVAPKSNAAIAVGAISSQYMGTEAESAPSFVGGAHFDLSLDPPSPWPWPVATAAAQRWFIGLD